MFIFLLILLAVIYIFSSAKSVYGGFLMVGIFIGLVMAGFMVGGFLGISLVAIVYLVGMAMVSTKTYEEHTKEEYKITLKQYKRAGYIVGTTIILLLIIAIWCLQYYLK